MQHKRLVTHLYCMQRVVEVVANATLGAHQFTAETICAAKVCEFPFLFAAWTAIVDVLAAPLKTNELVQIFVGAVICDPLFQRFVLVVWQSATCFRCTQKQNVLTEDKYLLARRLLTGLGELSFLSSSSSRPSYGQISFSSSLMAGKRLGRGGTAMFSALR
jgi:hypothetical protein